MFWLENLYGMCLRSSMGGMVDNVKRLGIVFKNN